MIRFFLSFKRAVVLSCFLMTASSSVSSNPTGEQPSAAPVKELRRVFEVLPFSIDPAAPSPSRSSSLVAQCHHAVKAGKAQRQAKAKSRNTKEASPLVTEEHQALLVKTVLSKDIAFTIGKFLNEQDLAAMGGTCRSAYRAYLNRGTCTLNLTPRPDESRDSQTLSRFLDRNRLARGLALGSPNLTRLQQGITEAHVVFPCLTTVSLPNTGFFGFSLNLLHQIFPHLRHINLQNDPPEEFSRDYLPRNKIGGISALVPFRNLASLNLRYADVTSLDGLNSLHHLNSLDITGNSVSPEQHASLAHVPTLTSLTVAWDYGRDPSSEYRLTATDVEFLRSLPLLETLNLNWQSLENLDPSILASLTHLRCLDLGRTGLPTVVFAQNFHRLTHVDLSENSLTTIDALSAAKEMISLDLSHNNISDLGPLEKMKKLRVLDLSYNKKIINIKPLSGCTDMEKLSLANNLKVGTLESLRDMTQMVDLNIDTTGTSSFLPLVRMTRLKHLNANGNAFTDASPLSLIRSLQTLYLGRNPLLKEEGPIYALENLIVLHLTGISVKHPEKLAGLSYLVELDLVRTGIENLDMFEGLTFLSRLFLEGNSLTAAQLNPLFSLTGLSTLCLKDNPRLTEDGLKVLKNRLSSTDVVT
jgi:Leucine-rich repeat (LRR) protein